MISKDERERDKAVCEAASPDWRAGVVETDNIYVRSTHPNAVGPERVLMRANIHFPYEADVRAAAHCRNRLPAYIADAEEMERRIAEVEAVRDRAMDLRERVRGIDGEYTAIVNLRAWESALRILRGQP